MRIVVAMSGGVDSSVAALKLKQKGYDVIGVTIKTWPKEECGTHGEMLCCSLEAIQYARSVADDLEIPFYVIDLSKEFGLAVKDYFADEYARGRTPNPCIYCNSKIKFGYLLDRARQLGAEKIATGHYARIIRRGKDSLLAEAKDKTRDQSYFLYDIRKETLSDIEFPLGEVSKSEVRAIAAAEGFMTAQRPDSQDICFETAGGGYREYLQKLGVEAFREGDILDVLGKVIGRHKGIASYTTGQRRGIGVSAAEALYVTKIDPENNTVTVGERAHAMKSAVRVAGFNWLAVEGLRPSREFHVKIRYSSEKVRASLTAHGDDEAIVRFGEPQFAPAPGQAAVFYDGVTVACGGWIEEVIE